MSTTPGTTLESGTASDTGTSVASAPATAAAPASTAIAGGSTESCASGSLPTPALITTLVSSIGETIDAKFRELKEEVKQEQELAARKSSKRAKLERPQVFKFKGNEDQFYFNEKVAEALDETSAELRKAITSPVVSSSSRLRNTLEKAMEAAREGEELLRVRQKHIQMADRSEHGWRVVKEYGTDDLANDSGDEKRIAKAEKAAEAKASATKKKKLQSARPIFPRASQPWPSHGSAGGPPYAIAGSRGRANPTFGVPRSRPLGPCFACHEYGHLRNMCPKIGGARGQQYPLNVSVENVDVSGAMCKKPVNAPGAMCIRPVNVSPEQEECELLLSRFWEAEHAGCSVKGRLKESYDFWATELSACQPVLDIVGQGYYLPLLSIPDSYSRPNHETTKVHKEFVNEAVADLLHSQCIRQVAVRPHVCSPLMVVESSSGKKRLVINLKYLNMYLWKDKFKYEDMRTALLYLEKDDFLCTFDLKSGYHHVDIHAESQKFLGFEWEHKHYVFTVLPFGLATACYVFTKLLRPIVKYLRARGARIVIYIDDVLAMDTGFEQTSALCKLIRWTLCQAGFVINEEKSGLEPSKCVRWLGFDIDLRKGCIMVPHDKVTKLQRYLSEALENEQMPAKKIASLTGKIIALGIAIGPVTRLRTRALYALLESKSSWYDRLVLSDEARREVSFWSSSLQQYNGQPIWRAPSAVRVVYSDASDTGFGGYTVQHGGHVVQGQWSEQEAGESSTWRELRAVGEVLETVAPKMINHRIRWFTDNQNVVRIIQVGSGKENLQVEALRIFELTVRYSISLEPEWIPREQNQTADYISRIIDYDDWGIDPAVFDLIDSRWGPHTVDRFASKHNAKLNRFNSRFLDYNTEAVDAFTVDWQGENNYLCPPVYLVPRVLRHAQACRCVGSLVVPEWPSAAFWPLLCVSEWEFQSFVVDAMYLPLSDSLIVRGKAGATLFKNGWPNTNMLALRIEFH